MLIQLIQVQKPNNIYSLPIIIQVFIPQLAHGHKKDKIDRFNRVNEHKPNTKVDI
jgi:hypothetical protein